MKFFFFESLGKQNPCKTSIVSYRRFTKVLYVHNCSVWRIDIYVPVFPPIFFQPVMFGKTSCDLSTDDM